MVEVRESAVVITVAHAHPHEFVYMLQSGGIDVIKTLLMAGDAKSDVILDRDTADGCISILELVQATLFEPKLMESFHKLAVKEVPSKD